MNTSNTQRADRAKSARQVKVSYIRKRHQDPKTGRTRHYSRHPSLVLSGNWLEEAGFPTGVSVSVTIEYGKLILKPQPDPAPTPD